MSCLIRLDNRALFCDLPAHLVMDLLADTLARYEALFVVRSPVYPKGRAELLYQVLQEGFGLQPCELAPGAEIISLHDTALQAKACPEKKWKDEHSGRALARLFAATLSNH